MADWYMVAFILFIGMLIGMIIGVAAAENSGLIKPDALDEVLIMLAEAYDETMMPPDTYYELREGVIALKESSHIKAMDVLQEMSIERGRREAVDEVLEILTEIADEDTTEWYEYDAIEEAKRRIVTLQEEKG